MEFKEDFNMSDEAEVKPIKVKKEDGFKEELYPEGEVIVEAIDKKTGKVIDRRENHNLIVNSGKRSIATQLRGGGRNLFSGIDAIGNIHVGRIKIGTNGISPTLEDIDLRTVYATAVTGIYNGWSAAENKRIIWVTFTGFTEIKNICEAGFFSPIFTMINRVTFAAIEVSPDVNLRVLFKFTP